MTQLLPPPLPHQVLQVLLQALLLPWLGEQVEQELDLGTLVDEVKLDGTCRQAGQAVTGVWIWI